MFTIEYDFDNIEINILDDSGQHEDLKIDSFDDIVYIRQWDEDKNDFVSIVINPHMWEELMEAMNKGEGAYVKR